MKKFRFTYWLGSITTEAYIKAENKDKALEMFRKLKGNKKIADIECDDD